MLLNFELARAKIAEGVGGQSGNAHLRDSEPLADLRSCRREVHQQDFSLTRGQLVPVRGDGLHADHVLQSRTVRAE
jgi:hypothetical protein